jgi:ABC-type transport system involved in multi-copper enzyme maturation permease subunit
VKAYLHDLRSILASRLVLVVVVLTLLGGALAYGSVEGQVGVERTINGSGFYYFQDNAYHIDLWTFDGAGEPLRGVAVELNISLGVNSTAPSRSFYTNVSSDSSGQLQFVVPIPDENHAVQTLVYGQSSQSSSFYLQGALQGGFTLANLSTGQVSGLDPLTAVAGGFYSSVGNFIAIWGGPNGSFPTGVKVVDCSYTTYNGSSTPTNCSALPTHVMGSLTGLLTDFPEPQAPSASSVIVELIDPEGAVVGTVGYAEQLVPGAPVQPQPTISADAPGVAVLLAFEPEASLLLALMALVLAYWTYAQPRLSATFEPILVRPVTRRGLLLSRFAGMVLLLAAAAVAQVLILDLVAYLVLNEPLPAAYIAPLVASLLVAGVPFAGLVCLMAHGLKSAGAVFASSIGLVAVFGLFWGDLTSVNPYASAGPNSYWFLVYQIHIQLLSPVELPHLVLGFLTGSGTNSGVGSSYALAGLTPGVLAAVASLWVVLPLLGAFYLATVRD